ncbi:MAG: NAD(P)/FAD-dependent oxidoreductase [Lachnospiraceae bacterium]|nr:NAD(P)/FAD-dependent oxidoreductase [Lachnospiraceae bacterium]
MRKVVVIGGGAAGMMAAYSAAISGKQVDLYEKNEKLGKKIFITGKGRCNITNACSEEEFFEKVVTNPRFLYSSYYGFQNFDMIDFLEKHGVKTKVERGNRVFPVSDHSSDIIDGLHRAMKKQNVKIHLNSEVKRICFQEDKVEGIELADGKIVLADSVIIATGGLSYPSTGSTGDGYRFAKSAEHKVTKLTPALVPFNIREDYVKELQGLSLRNIEISIKKGKKVVYKEFGELLFTHFGVSGPTILSASSYIQKAMGEEELVLSIDLKPALDKEQLSNRLIRDFKRYSNKKFINALGDLFPSKLIPVMVKYSGIPEDKRVNEITKEEREHFADCIKNFSSTIEGLRGYNEAIITKGGVEVKEINPSTMESKKVKGLFFAGEVLDLDAVTGGFNLQIAWSTGYAAGKHS